MQIYLQFCSVLVTLVASFFALSLAYFAKLLYLCTRKGFEGY